MHTLKDELVPNFSLLDHNVQKEIVHILDLLLTRPDKKVIQEFSRLGFLEEAPLLRSHIWKRITIPIATSLAGNSSPQPPTLE